MATALSPRPAPRQRRRARCPRPAGGEPCHRPRPARRSRRPGIERRGAADCAETARPLLRPDQQRIAKTRVIASSVGSPLALEQRIGGNRSASRSSIGGSGPPLLRSAAASPRPRHRHSAPGFPTAAWRYAARAIGRARNHVGKGAATVDPELPRLLVHRQGDRVARRQRQTGSLPSTVDGATGAPSRIIRHHPRQRFRGLPGWR